jgi:cardiolipin synthase
VSELLLKGLLGRMRRRRHAAQGLWKYVPHPRRMRRHTRVFPLRSGHETFPAMLGAIERAQRLVHLEMYIWADDRTGNRFREALIDRARNGCAVRVIYDAVGSFSLPGRFVDSMREAGIEVIQYHPVAPWRPRWGLNRRNHKKILVVDDRLGFTGGINLSDENLPVEEGGKAWFDWHVGLEGPAVHELAVAFRHTWLREGGTPYPPPPVPPPCLGRNVLAVQVISNVRLKDRWRMHRSYLWAIRQAERDICIMNSYFVPERGLRRAFRSAAARGVSVRVIVPQVSDVPPVAHASRHLHKRLILSGVRIFEWPPERMMHAKLGVIDDVWSTIGSYNLDHRSLHLNLEVGLVALDERLGLDLREQFEKDIARCTEVTIAKLDARSPWQKFLDWGWYQLRSQL